MAEVLQDIPLLSSQVDNEHQTSTKDFGCDVMLASLQKQLQIIRSRLESAAVIQHSNEEEIMSVDQAGTDRNITTLLDSNQRGLPSSRRPQLALRIKRDKVPTLSAEKQQYYTSLVDNKERSIIQSSYQCLLLMEQHVNTQLKTLQQNDKKLTQKLQNRLQKEKNTRLLAKPIRCRSQLINQKQVTVYKSSFYRNVCENDILKSNNFKERHKLSKRRMLNARSVIPEQEEENEPSNSWAITGLKTDKTTPTETSPDPVLKPKYPTITPLKPPEFIPIRSILGDGHSKEKERHRIHVANIQKQVTNRRQMVHMYRKAKDHQNMMSVMSHDLWEEFDTFTPTNSAHKLVKCTGIPTPRKISKGKKQPSPSSLLQQLTERPSSLQSLASQRSQRSPVSFNTPPLTMEHIITDSLSSTKEAKRLSSLWTNY